MTSSWDTWVEKSVSLLKSQRRLFTSTPIMASDTEMLKSIREDLVTFNELGSHDRSAVEIEALDSYFNTGNNGEGLEVPDEKLEPVVRKMTLFSSNDYLALSSHPAVRKIAAETALLHGMGPRGSIVLCGYTNYHAMLDSCLADLKKKEDCVVVPTGFSANTTLIAAIGSVASLSAENTMEKEKIAIFSDALNHASIIDGIRLAERRVDVETFVYRHCESAHLDELLSSCTLKKKVVISDGLFSMDGDFAPMDELVELRKKHGFLLVIDDAHGTLVTGENGGGIGEMYNCEDEIDICVGTLSKGVGCIGGYIACSKKWKQLIETTGRSLIFTTTLPLPIVAAIYAAIIVGKRENWRRRALRNRIQEFRSLTHIPVTSHIVSLVVGDEEAAISASRYLLENGFHVKPVLPPMVPVNSCRLRISLTAAHTALDIKKLTSALSHCIKFPNHINGVGY